MDKAILPVLIACLAATAGSISAQTNVVVIMIDDMGWTDLGCQGNAAVDTPRIDRLAGECVRFTNAYAASPVCSPVRAALLTGLAPARLRITNHIPDQKRFIPEDAKLLPAPMFDHLDTRYETMAEHLKSRGYATSFIGKWHLSGRRRGKGGLGDVRYYPEEQGFDSNVGGCSYGGPPTFFDPYGIHNIPPRAKGEYLPDRLADESIAFIRSQGNKPFFLCLWPYAVHWPMEAPAALVKKYEWRKGPGVKDPRYAAMTEALDTALGRVFDALESTGVADRTLVVLTSDNGPYLGVAEPKPLREGKCHLYEGGIRVPMIIRWPGRARKGAVDDTPVITMDILPTVLEAAGAPPAALADGESLASVLSAKGGLKREALFWHYPNYAFHRGNRLGAAIRQGGLKLIRWFDGGEELYDLEKDISESRDLAREPEHAAAVKRLRGKLDGWLTAVKAAMPARR